MQLVIFKSYIFVVGVLGGKKNLVLSGDQEVQHD